MKKKGIYFILGFLLFILLNSCNNKVLFNENLESVNGIWAIDENFTFKADINETESYCDIFIDIEITKEFLTNNLWLFIESKSPNGNVLNDSMMYFLADEKGRWFGDEKGNHVSYKFLYKPVIRFPENGVYTFKINHGMRQDDLPKIRSVGITISKSELLNDPEDLN